MAVSVRDERREFAEQHGRRFLQALDDRELTQADAARILEIHPSRVNEYVRGLRLMPVDTLVETVAKLDLDPAILFPEWFKAHRRLVTARKRKIERRVASMVAVGKGR